MKLIHLNSVFERLIRPIGIGKFLRWWGTGLLAYLPLSLHRFFTESTEPWVIQVTDGEIVFLERQEGKTRELHRCSEESLKTGALRDGFSLPLAQSQVRNKRIILRLPTDKVLVKTISLPAAAESDLRQVIGFEIDRLTPFSADKIYYDAGVIERQVSSRRIQVRFITVPRTWMDSLLRPLDALGFAPDTIDVAGETAAINLLPPERRPRKGLGAQRLRWGLVGLLLVLLLTASLLPLWQQRSMVIELLSEVAAAQQEAEEILALRNELEQTLESSRFLLQKKVNDPLVIELLHELTRIFPDHTWVEQLTIQGDEIQVRGQSEEALALIGQLESSELFHQVTFRSPVTVDRRTGKDRFYLSAQIVKES